MRFVTAAENALRFLFVHGLDLSVLSVPDAVRVSRRLRARSILRADVWRYEEWFDLGGEG